MLDWSIDQQDNPVAIRVPWTKVYHTDRKVRCDYAETKYEITKSGSVVAIIALGSFYQIGEELVNMLQEKGINATLINPLFITGLDCETLEKLRVNHRLIVTLEDGILGGGFGSKISQYYGMSDMKVMNKAFATDVPNRYIPEEYMRENRLLSDQIVQDILDFVGGDD